MSNSKHTGHVTETPDVSYIKNVDVRHEVSDVYISAIAKFVIGLFALMVVSFFLMWVLFRAFESKIEETPASPMALTEKDRLPPEPRLQGAPGFAEEIEKKAPAVKKEELGPARTTAEAQPKDPLWEIRTLRAQWNDVLEHGPLDQSGKRYGMPIEKAKEEILKQGLPARAQTAVGSRQ
jgi:hypothetical protein